MPDSNNDDWVRTGQSKRTTRGIHPPGAFSVWPVAFYFGAILLLLLLGAIPTAVAVEPTTGVLEEDTLPTAAPVIVEYWKDNNPYAAEDNDNVETQQPSPAPILWDYWPSTTYTTSAPSETTTTAATTTSSTTNAKDPDQTEEDKEDDGDADEDDPWLLYVILGAAGVGLIVFLGGCAYGYRYHKCCCYSNNNHRASSSTSKKAEEATDRSTADETEGGGAENDVDTQPSSPAGWTVSETTPEDLEQPPPRSPREECPSTSTWIPSPIAQPSSSSSSSPQHAPKQPQQRQSTTQQQQQQQQQQQRTELRVPTLQCRKLLTVASVKAALVQQESKHGPIILLSDDEDDDEEPGDSLAVRELKQANAVLAGHHTEL